MSIKNNIKKLVPNSALQRYEKECRKETHINRALSFFEKRVYAEIGVHEGVCIRQIRAEKKAAVDPNPVNPGAFTSDSTSLFEMTSDEFFNAQADAWLDATLLDVSLVDGLHEFEQALRDVLNLEPLMHPRGVIFIHDCNPKSFDQEQNTTGLWMGDVWKVPYYLSICRPDLKVFTLDCDWGLCVLTGFSNSPPSPDAREIARIKSLHYDFLDDNRQSILKLRNPIYSRLFFSRLGHFRK